MIMQVKTRENLSDEELIEKYKLDGDIRDRDEVILRYTDMARELSKKYACRIGWLTESSDLFQEGMARLIRRAGEYKQEKAKFSTFAGTLLRGAMRDYIISNSWGTTLAVKNQSKINGNLDNFLTKYGRLPSEEEEIEILGERNYRLRRQRKLKNFAKSGEDFRTSLVDEKGIQERISGKELVGKSLRGLKRKDKALIFLLLGQEMTYKEISQTLGLSEAALYARMKRNSLMDQVKANHERIVLSGGLERT